MSPILRRRDFPGNGSIWCRQFPSFSGGVSHRARGRCRRRVTSIIDHFAEAELLSLNSDVGYSDAQSRALNSIQETIPISGGVTGALSEFSAALSDLVEQSRGHHRAHQRDRQSARALGENLSQTRQSLTSLQSNLDSDIQSAVQRVNNLTEQIARLKPANFEHRSGRRTGQ